MTVKSSSDEMNSGGKPIAAVADVPASKQERELWNKNYKANRYAEVLNVTGCPQFRRGVIDLIDENVKTILIPGCGSEPHLARGILENCPQVELVKAFDWAEEAIQLAQDQFTHEKLVYEVKDTSQLTEKDGPFDMIIVVNAILSHSDLLNRAMLSGCFQVLKNGGVFYGLFPDILCSVELGILVAEFSDLINSFLDLGNSTVYEERQGMSQIFYTPQRLKQILADVGFQLSVSDITREAFDSDYFQSEYERLYGIQTPDICLWENKVILRKPRADLSS